MLLAAFGVRAINADQPVVENYVGRQIPTAMVARNLDRGSGFFRPQLDTGPFPNYFLVEPPVYAQVVVWFHRLTGVSLEPSGRLVSALGMTLGAWGLYGLARRREGRRVALGAVAAFAVFPVTIRYGRAFQPDALMLGSLLAGLRCWDEYEARREIRWLVLGWSLTSAGLALKWISAYLLIPLIFAILRPRRTWKIALAASTLLPAILWYINAWPLLSVGSRASADNAGRWMAAVIPTAWTHGETYRTIGQLLVRAFTPLGLALAAWGFVRSCRSHISVPFAKRRKRSCPLPSGGEGMVRGTRSESGERVLDACSVLQPGRLVGPFTAALTSGGERGWERCADADHVAMGDPPWADSLWPYWALALGVALVGLSGKLHHEYYWMALAPLVAVGSARALVCLAGRRGGRAMAVAAAGMVLVVSAVQSASTWRTPREWQGLEIAARELASRTRPGAWVVAPEALLYATDRRGCRLEADRRSAERAAGEWGGALELEGPLALVEFYRSRGAGFVADVYDPRNDASPQLHEAIRRTYRVLVDRPGLLLASLREAEGVRYVAR